MLFRSGALEIQRAKAELNSLCLDVSAFTTLDEQKQLLNQQKLAAESGGSKQPVRIPYASVPWQQALCEMSYRLEVQWGRPEPQGAYKIVLERPYFRHETCPRFYGL